MLHKTQGIVLHSVKYSETSLIVRIYTELFGLQSYMVKGARSPKSRFKPALFQPLALLDLVVYRKETGTLHAIKEASLSSPYLSIPFDIRKSSVALFLNELIYKSIQEEEPNPGLFAFLWASFQALDSLPEMTPDFHLDFALRLTRYLGFYPQDPGSPPGKYFNLKEGTFQKVPFPEEECLDDLTTSLLWRLLQTPGEGSRGFTLAERNQLLNVLIRYYRTHLPGLRELRSHEILHEVLS